MFFFFLKVTEQNVSNLKRFERYRWKKDNLVLTKIKPIKNCVILIRHYNELLLVWVKEWKKQKTKWVWCKLHYISLLIFLHSFKKVIWLSVDVQCSKEDNFNINIKTAEKIRGLTEYSTSSKGLGIIYAKLLSSFYTLFC